MTTNFDKLVQLFKSNPTKWFDDNDIKKCGWKTTSACIRDLKKIIKRFKADGENREKKGYALYFLGWIHADEDCIFDTLDDNSDDEYFDSSLAKTYYNMSIELGNHLALHGLGMLYYNQKKYDKAKEIFEKGVEKGESNSISMLGAIYENGFGVDTDLNKAIDLYKEGINMNNSSCMSSLADIYMKKSEHEKEDQEIRKYRNMAIRLYERAIDLDDSYAADVLSAIYSGESYPYPKDKPEVNKSKAFELQLVECVMTGNPASIIHDLRDFNKCSEFFKNTLEKIKENQRLQKENEELRSHIEASPDGKKYFEAKKEWETNIK